MLEGPLLETDRLRLRPFCAADREPFAALNSDPLVMEHFAGLLSAGQSDAFAERIESRFQRDGFGLWAVEVKDGATFIGFVGLSAPAFEAHFTPAIEVGWRLAREHWGQGYATEAARAVLAFAFDVLGLEEVVSFTAPANLRSMKVMEKVGLVHDPAGDFDHPALPAGHPLRRHVLYRIRREERR